MSAENDFPVAVGHDKNGPLFAAEDVATFVANEMNAGQNRHVKKVATDLTKARGECDESVKLFQRSLDNLVAAEKQVAEASKKVSGQIRKSANDLSDGLQRIEKLANFDKLERYVLLLERAANAMTLLASLEQGGKLNKIIAAVK